MEAEPKNWKIETLKGYTHQSGHFHLHEVEFTRGCISPIKEGGFAVLLDDDQIEELIKDLRTALRRAEQTKNHKQYNDLSDTAMRFVNIAGDVK